MIARYVVVLHLDGRHSFFTEVGTLVAMIEEQPNAGAADFHILFMDGNLFELLAKTLGMVTVSYKCCGRAFHNRVSVIHSGRECIRKLNVNNRTLADPQGITSGEWVVVSSRS